MRSLVVMFAVLVLVSVAGADQQVWFQVTSGAYTVQGAPGVSTVLSAASPSTSWGIDVYMRTTSAPPDGGVIGYDIALNSPSAATSGGALVPSVPAGWGALAGSTGSGSNLLRLEALSGIPAAPLAAGDRLAGHFTLTQNPALYPDADVDIVGGVAGSGWGFASSFNYGDIQFGGAASIVGDPWNEEHGTGAGQNWADTYAIKIVAVPEPASLMLLGLGLVGLLRRR